jgi:hypothetical protein
LKAKELPAKQADIIFDTSKHIRVAREHARLTANGGPIGPLFVSRSGLQNAWLASIMLGDSSAAMPRSNLIGYDLPEERVRPSAFELPTPNDISDAASAHLLWQAARLTLREGATPLRSLGRISIRPRVYQFVPLLMALRLDPVRLLIADDVGAGKTIEALPIAREMLDRGEIRRMAVICLPSLCDQWQKELADKFNLDAVAIRSGTVNQLDRHKTSPESIYRHYPIQAASIDFLKSDRNRLRLFGHKPIQQIAG